MSPPRVTAKPVTLLVLAPVAGSETPREPARTDAFERGSSGLDYSKIARDDRRPPADKLRSILPEYLKECVDKKGFVIPGLPGSVMPRTEGGVPTGVNWRLRF